jgi:hypothetical protein
MNKFSIINFQIIFNFRIFKHLINCHCEEQGDEAISLNEVGIRNYGNMEILNF